MKKYVNEIQLQPQIHNGAMKHFWAIHLITSDGKYLVAHGYTNTLEQAYYESFQASKKLGLN